MGNEWELIVCALRQRSPKMTDAESSNLSQRGGVSNMGMMGERFGTSLTGESSMKPQVHEKRETLMRKQNLSSVQTEYEILIGNS